MARTPSTMLALGTAAPDFNLVEPASGKHYALSDFSGKPLLVVFICNHCPYVIHLAAKLAEVAKANSEVAFVAINSNDAENYPADAPENMAAFAQQYGFDFPYLFDATQAVAQRYQAACTPDFYLFSAEHTLVYRGQFDAARPHNAIAPSGEDLQRAISQLLAGEAILTEQSPSLGCNIKWRPGHEPAYFTHP
ncbi:MAG: thioredoxin family protein [Gammaproteobacteria bacterium]|nr:thioredoxin family protein [Gammaproteobacteria bacterium]